MECKIENCRLLNIAVDKASMTYPVEDCIYQRNGQCYKNGYCNGCKHGCRSIKDKTKTIPDLHSTYCWECYNGAVDHRETKDGVFER